MEKFIPYEKLSKKEQRKRDAQRRGSWQGLSPVTRRPENPKAYNRRKAQNWKKDPGSVPFCFIRFYNKCWGSEAERPSYTQHFSLLGKKSRA